MTASPSFQRSKTWPPHRRRKDAAARRLARLLAALAASTSMLLSLSSCQQDSQPSTGVQAIEAHPIEHHECAVCGMVVREQPAPRAQAVHRDGSREYFCSIGDFIHYTQTPSPHGQLTHRFVEILDPQQDPGPTRTAARPWARAPSASYVLGVPRSGIMGPPVLVYESRDVARSVSRQHGGQVHSWNELKTELGARAQR